MNPARSLAPCIVNHSFDSNHWIYWVGPTAGACLAALIYKLVKALEYETANDEDQSYDPLPQAMRQASVIVPMTSIAEQSRNPKTAEVKAVPAPRLASPVPPPAQGGDLLPECYAD